MADEIQSPGSTLGTLAAEGFAAFTATLGSTPQAFVAELLKPFEERIADRICDLIIAKFAKTAEMGHPNVDLQNSFNKPFVPDA